MKSVEELKKAISALNSAGVRYCVLRNYEFLIRDTSEKVSSLDTVFAKSDLKVIEEVLSKIGFLLPGPKSFAHKHWGLSKYIETEGRSVGFDGQIQDLHWNDIPYMDGNLLFKRRKKVRNVFTLSDEDSYIMFATHSILGKRSFKEKYRKILAELSTNGELDWGYVDKHISRIFGRRNAKYLMRLIGERDFDTIEKKSFRFILEFLLRKPNRLAQFLLIALRWVAWKFRKSPLIAVVGPDGAGKSTAVENLVKFLSMNDRKVAQIYLGRGKSQLLPIKKIGRGVQRNVVSRSSFTKKVVYTMASPIYTLDLLLRYFFVVMPKRRNRMIIISDRYATDILLMENVPFFVRRLFFALFPKPTLSFYLYNDPETLYSRRKQQSEAELSRQMKLFDYVADKIKAKRVKTGNEKQTLNSMAKQTLELLRMKGF